jgi:hypothetical protein
MEKIFDEKEWAEKIRDPLWYMEVPLVMKKMAKIRTVNEKEKERTYSFFEKQLLLGNVSLGEKGKDFDAERKEIDTIVIHHTHGDSEMTKERLSAMELLRLYAPFFANPTYEGDKEIKGQPIFSGHFRQGKQVFYPYHWIIRKDGTAEQLLFDNEIGWHAGNWEVNCRSVAIVFDNNYENSVPSKIELDAVVKLIKEKYSNILKDRIFGHREINVKTTCPSNLFLSEEGKNGWKEGLLNLL